jgi:hypothetical protein
MKFHPRYTPLLFAFFMSCGVAFIVSGVLTAIIDGFDNFIQTWMLGFSIAWPVACSAVLVLAPRVRRLVQHLTAQ